MDKIDIVILVFGVSAICIIIYLNMFDIEKFTAEELTNLPKLKNLTEDEAVTFTPKDQIDTKFKKQGEGSVESVQPLSEDLSAIAKPMIDTEHSKKRIENGEYICFHKSLKPQDIQSIYSDRHILAVMEDQYILGGNIHDYNNSAGIYDIGRIKLDDYTKYPVPNNYIL